MLWWVVDQGELLECRPNPERVVLVNGKVVWMVLSHRRRSWMVSVWGGWVELEVAESVGGKWGLLDGCGVRKLCEGGRQYLLLVGAGCAPGKVPLQFCVGESWCRFVKVSACCSCG